MKIIGVQHGYRDFSHDCYRPVQPSKEAKALISDLPKGSTVGIELVPKNDAVALENSLLENLGHTQVGAEYFQKIENLCKDKDLEIVYLEDPAVEVKKLEALRKYIRSEQFGDFMNYFKIFNNQREDTQRELLRQHQPDLSFVGTAHANRLHFEKPFAADICFEMPSSCGKFTLHDEAPKFSEKLLELSFSLDRFVNLYFNKQFSERKPDYVGLWSNSLVGYFELYLQSDGMGEMHDFLGRAAVQGNFSDDKMLFMKQYYPGAQTSLMNGIYFEAERVEKGFFGMFEAGNYSDNFVCGQNIDPKMFSDEQFRSVFNRLNESLSLWSYDQDRIEELESLHPDIIEREQFYFDGTDTDEYDNGSRTGSVWDEMDEHATDEDDLPF